MSVASKPSNHYQFVLDSRAQVEALGIKEITDIESIKTGDWILYHYIREIGYGIMAYQVVQKTPKRVTIITLNYDVPDYDMGMREKTQLSLANLNLCSDKKYKILLNKTKRLRFRYHLTDAEFRTIFKIA